jgi:hypothetical protein
MIATEQARYEELYTRHLRTLKLQGKRDKTIDSYARAVRRVSSHFDCCPDQLTIEQLEVIFPTWLIHIPGVPLRLTGMACNSSGSMS